ncbi:hypothetical protein B9Z19DRAFT_1136437 [Tuber borchii]|uniref:Uncharacterized protein n=1 Tax=Tuber borchii TaxID=42251 RepID=A0A2T6ZBU0_TUBBO|nr:hypothetical protein B9Z19DRAFT_1136437 [Tuber borchii]
MMLQGNCSLSGALEHIVYLAKLDKKIPPTAGVQASSIARDKSFEYRQSPEDALVFGWILGIGHVIDEEIYWARVSARRRGEFPKDFFFKEDRGSGEDGDDNDGGPAINNAQYSTSLMSHEANSLKLSLKQHARFGKQEAIRSREQQAILFQHFEDQLKRYREQPHPAQTLSRAGATVPEDERIVYQAKLEKKISPTAGIKEGLRESAEGREFTDILKLEVKAHKLDDWYVMPAFDDLYSQSKYNTHGNDGAIIIVDETCWMDNHRAALVCFLKLQSSPCPLPWKEELYKNPKGGE